MLPRASSRLLTGVLTLFAFPIFAVDALPRAAETLEIDGHRAFVYRAPHPAAGKPWLWYAPTLKGLSLAQRKMYFEGLMGAGIALAGYDLGEVRGSPASTAKFTLFYEEMVRRGFSDKPILLGQSRGGMMMLAWAVRHPEKVRAFVGIYPVCHLASWPLKNSKADTLRDYALSEEELTTRLSEFNPLDHLQGLLAQHVPMFVVHGDADVVVPYDENTRILKERYEAGGGKITVKIIPGEGHKVSPSFFECRELLAFVLRQIRPAFDTPVMLAGPWVPEDTRQIDFDHLPRVPSQHAVINDVHAKGSDAATIDKKRGGVNQHNYLAFHDGRFWAMWSDGPGIEDRVGQRVKFSTSIDGLKWNPPQYLTPVPPHSGPDSPYYNTRTEKGFRYIARGFWKRDGELLALATLDEAAEFFGRSLELHAFRLKGAEGPWEDAGVVYHDAINNFPPLQLRSGQWMMSRRAHDYKSTGVHFLVGGVKALDQWKSFPVLGTSAELKAEEPDWWILPDQTLAAVFRDNRRSGFLYRAFSADDGRTWSAPVKTNSPDATSKISGLRLSDGRYVLVSNPNPKKRDPLALSVSDDGVVFNKMLYLTGGRHIDYPHVMEHEGNLYIAFAGGKQSVEVLKVSLRDMDAVLMPAAPVLAP